MVVVVYCTPMVYSLQNQSFVEHFINQQWFVNIIIIPVIKWLVIDHHSKSSFQLGKLHTPVICNCNHAERRGAPTHLLVLHSPHQEELD